MQIQILLCLCLIQSAGIKHRSEYIGCKSQGTTHGIYRNGMWHSAIYKGLIMGQSLSSNIVQVFGKPRWSGPPGDQTNDETNPELWYEYDEGGEFPGKLTVVVDARSGAIQRIDSYPENISKGEAIKHFGRDYILTRYDFDECLSDGESAPMYESPDGQFVSVEYRKRGIAVILNAEGNVHYISYVSKPIGATSSRCKQVSKQSRQRRTSRSRMTRRDTGRG